MSPSASPAPGADAPPSPPSLPLPVVAVRHLAARNPFRVLGVWANSSRREQLAHVSRMAAFLRVQRPVSFPADVIAQLPAPERTSALVAEAEAALSLPDRRLGQALFWFLNATPADAQALELLEQEDVEGAEACWQAAGGVSALQNLALCAFLTSRVGVAVARLEELYAAHSARFGQLVDESLRPTEGELVALFLRALQDEGAEVPGSLAPHVSRPVWKEWLAQDAAQRLLQLVKLFREREDASPDEAFEAARQLSDEARPLLFHLRQLLGEENPTFSNLSDQVATEVLQAAIFFFNEKDEPEVPAAALRMMKQARLFACGAAVLERCRKNIRTVKAAVEEQPPDEAGAEGQEIYRRLKALERKEADLVSASLMLRDVAPLLKALRQRLGARHAAYLRMSTLVVQYAQAAVNIVLGKAIEEMMEAQKRMDAEDSVARRLPFAYASQSPAAKAFFAAQGRVKELLRVAWDMLRKLEFYEMEPLFRRETYEKTRATVKRLCVQASIQTDYVSDSMRRHPGMVAVIALLAALLLGWLGWAMHETQLQSRELRELEVQAQTREDWEAVVAAGHRLTMASNRRPVLMRAEKVLTELREQEEELEQQYEQAQSVLALDQFMRLAEEYSQSHGGRAGERVSQLVQEAQQRRRELREAELQQQYEAAGTVEELERFVEATSPYMAEYSGAEGDKVRALKQEAEARAQALREQQRREKVEALLKQYHAATNFAELEAFVSAAAEWHTQDEELGRCHAEATTRARELRESYVRELEAGLKARFDKARSSAEFEAVAKDARAALVSLPAVELLARKAEIAAEDCRRLEKQQEEEKQWGTEARAWATVKREDTLDACRKYLERYPKGAHAAQAQKRVIDAEVAGVFASGQYGRLPETQRTHASRSSTATITVSNDTAYTLTLLYSGTRSEKLVIPARGTRSLKLPAATYKVVASVNSAGVRPFAGTETYSGGSYEASYYIATRPAFTPSRTYDSSADKDADSSPSSNWYRPSSGNRLYPF